MQFPWGTSEPAKYQYFKKPNLGAVKKNSASGKIHSGQVDKKVYRLITHHAALLMIEPSQIHQNKKAYQS